MAWHSRVLRNIFSLLNLWLYLNLAQRSLCTLGSLLWWPSTQAFLFFFFLQFHSNFRPRNTLTVDSNFSSTGWSKFQEVTYIYSLIVRVMQADRTSCPKILLNSLYSIPSIFSAFLQAIWTVLTEENLMNLLSRFRIWWRLFSLFSVRIE